MMGTTPADSSFVPATIADVPNAALGSEPAAASMAERPSLGRLLIFSAPAAGQGFMFNFVSMYLLFYSTEKLGVAPAVMGLIFLLSRVWDGISDPIAGYLSDRTQTRIGRRRPWLIAGAIPVGVTFYLMLNPPASLVAGSLELSLWMGAAVILFYTGMTVFSMPHDALAAELSTRYEERNRIFGIRRIVHGIGSLGMFPLIYYIPKVEDSRALVSEVSLAAAVLTAICMLGTGFFMRERLEYQGRGSENPFRVWLEVYRNPHARVLMGVFFVQQLGIGAVSATAVYYAKYVLGDEGMLAPLMGGLFVCAILSVRVWVAFGRRYDKKTLINVAMWGVGAAFFAMGFLGEGDLVPLCIVASMAGVAIGCLDVMFPSLQADVIDYDELKSGERKEGVYFAVWHFAQKTSSGISLLFVGVILSLVGLEADVEQTETAKLGIRSLMSGIPLVTYGTGIFLFRRFSLTRETHAQIRRELDAR